MRSKIKTISYSSIIGLFHRRILVRLAVLFSLIQISEIHCLAQNPNPSSALDAIIQSEMNTRNFPGVSTVIVKDNQIVWVESYGFSIGFSI